MYDVSNEYKESIKQQLRNRGYILVSFGVINQEIQANAKVANADVASISSTKAIFTQTKQGLEYATFEQDKNTLIGELSFPPKLEMQQHGNSFVSNRLIDNTPYTVTINFNINPTDFKGLTVNFGKNYPLDFDIINGTQVLQVRNNDVEEYKTEEVFSRTNTISLKVYRMKTPNTRLRIYNILFGYGLIFTNDNVISSELDSYISPIGAEIPQIDFSVQLKNKDLYFNVDNPKSAINFLETGQEMGIAYGYDVGNGNIEWLKGNTLLCSEWESDDNTVTIKSQDVFRNLDTEYYKGVVQLNNISFYDLATEILRSAGVEKYELDYRLKSLYTKNPLPRCKVKEALQIIANACRCTLRQSRNGEIVIKSNFKPQSTASFYNHLTFARNAKILNDTKKDELAMFCKDYITLDGTMSFIAKNNTTTLNVGYVNNQLTNNNLTFGKPPKVTITTTAPTSATSIKLIFGNIYPKKFVIRAFKDNSKIDEYTKSKGVSYETTINHYFKNFDKLEIEFLETMQPNQQIILNNVLLGDVSDFTMERRDMTSSPKAIKQELIKAVVVPCYTYEPLTTQESIMNTEIETSNGKTEIFYMHEPAYNYTAEIENNPQGVQIVDSGAYFIKVQYNTTGKQKLIIKGYKYQKIERNITKELNSRGKTIEWKNPLISSEKQAEDLAEWLGEYYSSSIEYEYDTRGNPELDTNDIIYQENDFIEKMKVNVYRYKLNFNNAFSGSVTARRVIE